MIPVLGAAAVVGAVYLLWWAISGERAPSSKRNLMTGLSGSTDMRQVMLDRPAYERAVGPFMAKLALRARRFTPGGMVEGVERRIFLAGAPRAWPLERVLLVKVLLAAAVGAVVFLRLFRSPDLTGLSFGTALILGAYLLPDAILSNQAQKRQATIRRELADTLDQITITVEAGLGFEAALTRVAQAGQGPLSQELIRSIQDMNAGVPRRTALHSLVGRTNVVELRYLIHAILQAETYGIPIAQVLRVQSHELRVKRRQAAEERAMKMPVKLVFPLIFCILPALFVVAVGPAIIEISRSFLGNF